MPRESVEFHARGAEAVELSLEAFGDALGDTLECDLTLGGVVEEGAEGTRAVAETGRGGAG